MDIHKQIKNRRQELGMTDTEVSKKVGISIYEYGDVEQHPDEILKVVELRVAKKICNVLNLDFCELFDIKCDFCESTTKYFDEFSLPRNELINKKINEMSLTTKELGVRIGFEDQVINDMKEDPDFLEKWPLKLIKDLSNIIKVPFQILLKIKCKQCNC